MTQVKQERKDTPEVKEIGMLWNDSQKLPVEEKLNIAIGYFKNKYGKNPDVIYVNKNVDIEALAKELNVRHDNAMYSESLFLLTVLLKDGEELDDKRNQH